jgi:Lipid-droplet associated hydrolase
MARDEMRTISAPDASFLTQHSSKLWLYYAEKDDWVGKEREAIIELLGESTDVKIVHDKQGVPHAFCICRLTNTRV